MQNRFYYCHAVVNSKHVEDKFFAKTSKQAWYFFGKKYGFNMYDFKVIGTSSL